MTPAREAPSGSRTEGPEPDAGAAERLPRTLTSNEATVGRPRRLRRQRTPAHLNKLIEIKDAAAECFYTQGFAATDMRTIADKVDIQAPTLYNYISSKEELLYMIMSDGMIEITESLNRAIDGLTEPGQRLRAAVRSHVLHHTQRQHKAWVGHVEVRHLTGAYLEEILDRRRAYEKSWIAILQDGMKAGTFRDVDPRLTMFGILAIGQSAARWYKPNGQYDSKQIADVMADLVLDGMLEPS